MGTMPENETLEESLQIVKREANEMKRNFEKEDVDTVRNAWAFFSYEFVLFCLILRRV